jgi:two-component system, OmpR family, response regulator ChvI
MHTSNSFTDIKSPLSYYDTIFKSAGHTKIIEEGQEDEIAFSDKSQNCCVCFVSIVDSISAISEIKDPDKIRIYYSIFINTMAAIARNFNAKIIKNTASSLIFYFPKTSTIISLDSSSSLTSDNGTTTANTYEPAFRDVMECGITMIAARDIINAKLKGEGGLPSMHYKISADYGRVEVARSLSSPDTDDLFGSTMNVCAKINSMVSANGMVIGSKLYYIVRKLSTTNNTFDKGSDHYYKFIRIGQYSIDASFEKHQYPVYSVISTRNSNDNTLKLNEQIPKLKALVQIQHEYAISNQQLKKNFNILTINHNHYQQQQKHNHNNILVIDDEPDILLTYKTFLLTAGQDYNIDAFTDSQKALQQFVQVNLSYYDLVIMDIRMPNLNGLQLYYRLKAINPNIKILFVSALDAAQEMVSILPSIGIDDVIRKPVDSEQFLSKVKMTFAAKL